MPFIREKKYYIASKLWEQKKGKLDCTIGRIRRVIKVKFQGKSCTGKMKFLYRPGCVKSAVIITRCPFQRSRLTINYDY